MYLRSLLLSCAVEAESRQVEIRANLKREREEFECKMKEAQEGGAAVDPEIQRRYAAAVAREEAAEAAFAAERASIAESQDKIRELQDQLKKEEAERERQVEEFRERLEASGGMGTLLTPPHASRALCRDSDAPFAWDAAHSIRVVSSVDRR